MIVANENGGFAMELVYREDYMRWLAAFREKPLIKVLTGLRRVGKSTCLKMFADTLLKEGVEPRQIVSLNFEELELEALREAGALYAFLKAQLIPGKTVYFFLDEIQRVDRFEEVLDSLYVKPGVDLYVTGSNARLFSSEIATLLTGRYVELNVLPFSFREAWGVLGPGTDAQKLMAYFTFGALPETFSFPPGSAPQRQYVESVYNTILGKDVLKRNQASGRLLVDALLRYMIGNIGQLTSPKRIADRLSANGIKICTNTVQSYLSILCDCFFLYKADRFDVVGGDHLKLINKYYLTDFAFKQHLLGNPVVEIQQLLENTIYLELRRRNYKVATGKVKDKEVDFVVQSDAGEMKYVQVAVTVASEEKLRQELTPLTLIRDNHPKFLITMDSLFTPNHAGIKTINIFDFLLGKTEF